MTINRTNKKLNYSIFKNIRSFRNLNFSLNLRTKQHNWFYAYEQPSDWYFWTFNNPEKLPLFSFQCTCDFKKCTNFER